MSEINDISLSEEELCPNHLLKEQEEAFERDIDRLKKNIDKFVEVNCPACNQNKGLFFFEKFTFSYLKCQNCNTVYMSPRPSEEVMSDYYRNSENYAFWAKYIFPSSENSRREKIHKPWLKKIINICKKTSVSMDTLMEVGPGFGTFCNVAKESKVFKNVIAIEPTPELAEACRKRGINVIEERIEDISTDTFSADVLVAFEVIEHLFDPVKFIHKTSKLLKKNGLLILTCPNVEGFDIVELGSKSLAVDAEHVNLFNPSSLVKLVQKFNYEIVEISTPGRLDAEFVREAVLMKKHKLNSAFLKKILIDEWEKHSNNFQKIFIQLKFIFSHVVSCKKKLINYEKNKQ